MLVLVVLVENAARLSIPYLVKEGIDTGIPPIREDNNLEPLLFIVGIVLVSTITQAVARQMFLVRSGKIGQDVLSEFAAACSVTSRCSAPPSTTATRRAG